MTIEKLTDDERECLESEGSGTLDKALRIIDALNEALMRQLRRAEVVEQRLLDFRTENAALLERVAKATEILSNERGAGTWYAVPALEALRGP